MEEKLAAYRARKAKEKESEGSLLNRLRRSLSQNEKKHSNGQDQLIQGKSAAALQEEPVIESHERNDELIAGDSSHSTALWWTFFGLKFILWLCIWGIFIEFQFGAVFFTLSLMFFVYFNTRSGKSDSKLSAYSVFNKDCERIHGTVTAEQMQQNMFRVPGLPG